MTEEQETVKKGNALVNQKGEPTAHVPLSLEELKSVNGLIEKMGASAETLTNGEVGNFVRKLLGLPEKVRATGSPEKQNAVKSVAKVLRGMSLEDIEAFAKKNKIEIAKPEEKAEEKVEEK